MIDSSTSPIMDPDSALDGRDREKPTAKAERDPIYFFPPDLCIVLKVENTLFSIHLFDLLRHSDHFSDLFNSGAARGFTETNPFVVEGITAEEIRHFLRIILPSVTDNLEFFWTQNGPDEPVDDKEWLSILKVSTLWRCLKLRQLAIRQLQTSGIQPTGKIVLGRKYSVHSWVKDGYKEVVENEVIISDKEMEVIGAVESFKLSRLILENHQTSRRLQTPKSDSEAPVVSIEQSILFHTLPLEQRILQNFQAELESISAAETLLVWGKSYVGFGGPWRYYGL